MTARRRRRGKRPAAVTVLEVDRPHIAALGARRLLRRPRRARSSGSAAWSAPAARRRWRRSSACAPQTAAPSAVGGEIVDPRPPAQAIRAGIGFVAEDRRAQNIVPDLSVKENLLLAHLGAHRGLRPRLPQAREEGRRSCSASLGLPADRLLDANMLNFSGGMQQKIIIARWLLLEPQGAHPRRADQRRRHRHAPVDLRDPARHRRERASPCGDLLGLRGAARHLPSASSSISDGASIADLPSRLLDEEKLTLLAAPRTSMAAQHASC